MIAISYNSDLGDAWEWADDPSTPKRPLQLQSVSVSTMWFMP